MRIEFFFKYLQILGILDVFLYILNDYFDHRFYYK